MVELAQIGVRYHSLVGLQHMGLCCKYERNGTDVVCEEMMTAVLAHICVHNS